MVSFGSIYLSICVWSLQTTRWVRSECKNLKFTFYITWGSTLGTKSAMCDEWKWYKEGGRLEVYKNVNVSFIALYLNRLLTVVHNLLIYVPNGVGFLCIFG